MNATTILYRLDDLGISADLDGEDIVLRPGSKLPLELLTEIRANKPEILAKLAEIPIEPAPATRIIVRLQRGQIGLNDVVESFYVGAPTTTSVRFSAMTALWDSLEQELREDHGYLGCIHGAGNLCPLDTFVRCDDCIKD